MAIRFQFNPQKAAECAAFFIERAGGSMERLRLVKHLYLAERKSIEKRNRPIFGDHFASLPLGPVPEVAYRLIRNEGVIPRTLASGKAEFERTTWADHFKNQGHVVKMVSRLPITALSEAEIEILDSVHETHEWFKTREIVDLTHMLPEWQDPKGSSRPLPVESILAALHKSADEAREIEQLAEESADIDELLQLPLDEG